ncbi:hypothetical protein ACMGD3_18195 [Lysinibacillus sphaericus]|uniref:hypothetical protein n=1 Tax=Lysinibacillus sphaericus TaxID=1421 RepID=UPI003F7A17E1
MHHVVEDDHLRLQSDMKQIYARRKETIECVFATMNLMKLANWHGKVQNRETVACSVYCH